MRPSNSPSSSENTSHLTGREQKIAERVRRSLHLSASMPVDEVADQFRHSVAWRRERMGLAGEELRDRLLGALRSLFRRLWE